MPSTVSILPDQPRAVTSASRVKLLLQSFRAAALDAIAECGRGLEDLAKAGQADAIHDRQLVAAARVASIGGQEAEIRGCGCASRFDRVSRLVAGAQVADEREDSFVARAGGLFRRGVGRMRHVAGTADRVLGGKS